MPHKLLFRVVSASSQDQVHKAIELTNHSPGSKGWHSSNFCIYPQEIVLELENRCQIKKMQMLSHQYLIATKVEFFVGDCPNHLQVSINNSRFSRLGYVSLSDNEKTQFKARELKSVHVDAVGRYIRLVIHKNYINKHNHYNQVGIIAINVIGDEIFNSGVEEIENIGIPVKSDVIAPTEDLAFDMRVDQETADIIRKLEKQKSIAVTNEQFDKAQKIKDKITYLIELGEMIGKLEIEKKNAVEKQNYERAQLKKQQIEQYRHNAYRELDLLDLLHHNKYIPESHRPTERRQGSPLGNRNNNALTMDETPSLIQANAEDRPLPALRHKNTAGMDALLSSPRAVPPPETEREEDEPLTADSEYADNNQPNPDESVMPGMTKNDISEASDAIDVYGLPLVSRIYSKNWSRREDALLEIKKRLEEIPNEADKDDVRAEIKAAACILKKAFKTRVTQVIQVATTINQLVLVDLAERLALARPEIHQYLDQVCPEIFKCIEDMKVQIRKITNQHLIEMSQWETVKNVPNIFQEAIKPFNTNILVKDGNIKTELLLELYSIHGLCNHHFSLDNFMKYAVNALQHKSAEVRENAEMLIIVLYRNEDKLVVRSFLPLDDPKTRKNILYKRLFEKLDKIDGINPDANFSRSHEPTRPSPQDKRAAQKPLSQKKTGPRQAPPSSRLADTSAIALSQATYPPAISPAGAEEPTASDLAPYDETVCIFCGERNQDFVSNIDMHYWKYCPVLRRCPHCKQAVEISLLTQHLLQECEQHTQFSECPRCTEAIPNTDLDQHMADQLCVPAPVSPEERASHVRCPLCHENLALTGRFREAPEQLWQFHLMDAQSGCPQNPRRLVALQRQRQQQGDTTKGPNTGIKNNSKGRSQLPRAKAK